MSAAPLPASYVLPLSWEDDEGLAELVAYLDELASQIAEVIVVDGSGRDAFERHARALGEVCRHIRPHADLGFRMGKVNGVITGIREAEHERVVIADDDIRYDRPGLARAIDLLSGAELVRPQNFFRPLTWHARWDTARSLLNRVWSGDPVDPRADFPGTLAVRRSFFLAIGAYDGDVIFENLELIRTVRAAGGRVLSPLDLYVARRPPTTRHFLGQRVRQAYDDFALPVRLAVYLAIAPLAAIAAARRRPGALVAGALATVALAETGRAAAGGREVFPLSASLLAPAWVAERAICSWLAVVQRLRGGVPYRGERLPRAASREAELAIRRGSRQATSPTPAWARERSAT